MSCNMHFVVVLYSNWRIKSQEHTFVIHFPWYLSCRRCRQNTSQPSGYQCGSCAQYPSTADRGYPLTGKYYGRDDFALFVLIICSKCSTRLKAKWAFGMPNRIFGGLSVIITWLCDILALVWHFGPACVRFRPGLCDILALSCVTKASACHHTPILTTGAVYRKFHRSSVSKTT